MRRATVTRPMVAELNAHGYSPKVECREALSPSANCLLASASPTRNDARPFPSPMRKLLLPFLALSALAGHFIAADSASSSKAVAYKAVPNWYKLPEGRPQMGNMH